MRGCRQGRNPWWICFVSPPTSIRITHFTHSVWMLLFKTQALHINLITWGKSKLWLWSWKLAPREARGLSHVKVCTKSVLSWQNILHVKIVFGNTIKILISNSRYTARHKMLVLVFFYTSHCCLIARSIDSGMAWPGGDKCKISAGTGVPHYQGNMRFFFMANIRKKKHKTLRFADLSAIRKGR